MIWWFQLGILVVLRLLPINLAGSPHWDFYHILSGPILNILSRSWDSELFLLQNSLFLFIKLFQMRNLSSLTVFCPLKVSLSWNIIISSIQSEISSKVLKIEMKMSLKIFKADAVLEVCLLKICFISHIHECHTLAKTKTSRSGLWSASLLCQKSLQWVHTGAASFLLTVLRKAGFGAACCLFFFLSFLGMYFNNVDDFVLYEIAPKYLLAIYHSNIYLSLYWEV